MVQQPLTNPRVSNGTLRLTVVFIAVLLTFSFMLLILSTLAGLQLGNTLRRPNPFVNYEALWPGQPITSLATYGRQNRNSYLPCIAGTSPLEAYRGLGIRVSPGAYDSLGQVIQCVDYPNDGVFHSISVTIVADQIQQVEFHSDVLREDMLLLYWGMPDSITSAFSREAPVTRKRPRGKLVVMRAFKRVYELTEDEHRTLVQGTKSRSGFTLRRSHILLLSAEGLTPQQIARRLHCGEQTVRNVIRACLNVNPMTTGFFRMMTVWRFVHASK